MTQQGLSDSFVSDPTPRFLADRMLGRLAKWLRILGYDTAYLPQLSPEGVLREGRKQRRIILTRNTRLLRHKDVPPLVFVHSDHFREQLRQVIEECHLDPEQQLLTRCIECNLALEAVAKGEVRSRVPVYVWQTQETFRRCPRCNHIYWGATHRDHVLNELRQLGVISEGTAGQN
jgi:uncharacterized protein with PIN domain